MTAYDPAIHHRRSIRLKGHDYAGGGLYFVTLCAHREFIRFARGRPFGARTPEGATPEGAACVSPEGATPEGAACVSPEGATCVSPVPGMMAEEWKRGDELRDDVFPGDFVVMPDHFHGLIRIRRGPSELGHVIGAFKAAVSRRLRMGDTHVAPSQGAPSQGAPSQGDMHVAHPPRPPIPRHIRIWHRNYYERIVRTPEAERSIGEYIRANPWKLVQHGHHEGQPYRMIGNPALLNAEKIGVLCSRHCPEGVLKAAEHRARTATSEHCFIGGFHSPPEQAILAALLQSAAKLICCPAWGIDALRLPAAWLSALEANRMLILEMRNHAGDLVAAEERNRFVLGLADRHWLPHVAPGGMIDRITQRTRTAAAPRV